MNVPDVSRIKAAVRRHPVLAIGVVLVVAHLALRGWMLTHAWFSYDDFQWIQGALEHDLTLGYLLEPHVGHLMPAGFVLTWLNANLGGPLVFFWPAAELLVFQAVAGFGALRLLRHMFGDRLGILPPLAVFLFTPITLPAATWWAAGINQLPVVIAIIFGLHTHVTYLRTRRFRHAVHTACWVVLGLLFSEKAVVAYVVFGLVALCYFTTGHFFERLALLWRRYRAGIVLLLGVLAVYLPYYLATAINFEAQTVDEQPLGDLSFNLVAVAFASAIVGGPLEWRSAAVMHGIADPADLFLLLCWALIGAVVVAGAQSRRRSKRAWSIVGALLGVNVLLVATGRAPVVGPVIGLEYRYQTEVAIAAALSLALAFLPLRGADESAEPVREHGFTDSRLYVTLTTGLVLVLAVVSSVRFMALDLQERSPEAYFANLERSIERKADRTGEIPMANLGVPARIWSGFAFPTNLYRNMFVMYADELRYPPVSTDRLFMTDNVGNIRYALIDPLRHNEPGDEECTFLVDDEPVMGYVVDDEPETIPLDMPVMGFGWWMRIEYVATADSHTIVTVGKEPYPVEIEKGFHSILLQADGPFDDITIDALDGDAALCTNNVTLGTLRAFEPLDEDTDEE